jgi:hypothetical protein
MGEDSLCWVTWILALADKLDKLARQEKEEGVGGRVSTSNASLGLKGSC